MKILVKKSTLMNFSRKIDLDEYINKEINLSKFSVNVFLLYKEADRHLQTENRRIIYWIFMEIKVFFRLKRIKQNG